MQEGYGECNVDDMSFCIIVGEEFGDYIGDIKKIEMNELGRVLSIEAQLLEKRLFPCPPTGRIRVQFSEMEGDFYREREFLEKGIGEVSAEIDGKSATIFLLHPEHPQLKKISSLYLDDKRKFAKKGLFFSRFAGK